MIQLLPRDLPMPTRSRLEPISQRGYSGGWNAVDDDQNMQPRYLIEARNVRRTSSGGQEVRQGTTWFADVSSVVAGNILDKRYFNTRLIVVTGNGEIAAVDDDGVATAIWNATIASALPGTPSGWSSGLVAVNFVPFKDRLIIHNGVDKPVVISTSYAVTYLQDLASGSNVNVPIGKYGCTASNYHVVGGIPADPTSLYVSSQGTDGTFLLDPAPNDAIVIDVGPYAPEGAPAIRGLAGFRNFLIVFFRGQSLVIQLGNYNDAGAHVPVFNDTLPHYGILGHRCYITGTDNDLLFGDYDGFNSAKRSLFTSSAVEGTHESDIIEPAYQGAMGALTETEALYECFMVHDTLHRDLMLFIPGGRVFVRSASKALRYSSWSEFTEMDFTCGCTSFLGRVFLSKGTRIFRYGNATYDGEQVHADRANDRDSDWMNSTLYAVDALVRDTDTDESYKCLVSHTSALAGTFAQDRVSNPNYWELYEGEEIEWRIEVPWQDGGDPMRLKQLRYIKVQSIGTAEFTVSLFVDNLYKDFDGNVIYDPALTMDFVGNDQGGFGYDGPYGGGRRSGDPRLFGTPLRFNTIKFAMGGSSRDPLHVLGHSFLFSRGKFGR